jgi:hypothetical protein
VLLEVLRQLGGDHASTSAGSWHARRGLLSSTVPDRIENSRAQGSDDAFVAEFASAVAGKLGGKVGVTPRIFLKKLVADVLDRIDQFPEFRPREHYALTINESELNPVERQAMGSSDVDEVELDQ